MVYLVNDMENVTTWRFTGHIRYSGSRAGYISLEGQRIARMLQMKLLKVYTTSMTSLSSTCPDVCILFISILPLPQALVLHEHRDSLSVANTLVVSGRNSSCIGLGCNSALVIVDISIKVLNTSLVTHPERRTDRTENGYIMAWSTLAEVQRKNGKVWVWGKTYETIKTPPPKFLRASAKASIASISRWLEGSSRTKM